MMPSPTHSSLRAGLTLLETLIALALIVVILSIMLPALSTARVNSHRDQCARNLRRVGEAWQTYLAEHDKTFPYVPAQPAWYYGGMRISRIDGAAFPEFDRPLTGYLGLHKTRDYESLCVCCPADRGITGEAAAAGTGERTVFESFGTSYRANAPLLDVRLSGAGADGDTTPRGMRRSEITSAPARLVLCGDPVWYEVAEQTGRNASWHGEADSGNLLFLDGSVRFMMLRSKASSTRVLYDPVAPWPESAPAAANE